MKTSWLIVPLLIVLVLVSIPNSASAQLFEPIITEACRCPESAGAMDWGCVLQTAQNVMNIMIQFGVLIAAIVIAWAGALWILSPVNPQNREMGRTMLLNAVVGLVIVLVAWVFVDFLMKSLYNPSASGAGVTQLGPWNKILDERLGEEGRCIQTSVEIREEVEQPSETPEEEQPGEENPEEEPTPSANWQSYFGFQGNIGAQAGHASSALSELLGCMAGRLESQGHDYNNAISSISAENIANGTVTFEHCADVGRQGDNRCPHTVNSCHYGGASCNEQHKSYSADFGYATVPSNLRQPLLQAATACGAIRAVVENGNHIHVTAPNRCGQGGASCR